MTASDSNPLDSNSLAFNAILADAKCSCVLDPGSSISIASRALADSLDGIVVSKTHTVVRVANGQPPCVLGQCQIPLKIENSQLSVRFYVAMDLNVPCLIGLNFLERTVRVYH